MPSGLITLLTDFGLEDAYVGIMKGVMLRINPGVRLVDLTHAVPPQGLVAGALILRSAVGYFPDGTVHLAVVDPGVGSARRPILIETDRGLLVGPDNGILCPAAAVLGRRRARRLANERFFVHPVSQTFHGRDIFAPVAAHLSRGVDPTEVGRELVGPDNGILCPAAVVLGRRCARRLANERFFVHPVSQTFHGRDIFAPVAAHLSRGVAPEEVGRELDGIVELALPVARQRGTAVAGEVVHVDHFGNLITNITADLVSRFPGQRVSVSINETPIGALLATYSGVLEGAPIALIGSWGSVEIAIRNGNAAETFAAGPGTPVTAVVESRNA